MPLIKEINIASRDNDHSISGSDIKWSKIPIYPECQTLDLVQYFDLNKIIPYEIIFNFFNVTNIGVTLHIEERIKALQRRRSSLNILAYSGPKIGNSDLSSGRFVKTIMRLSQVINLEEEEKHHCKNYPNGGFQEYADCDADFVYKTFKEKYGVIPFWVTDNMTEVTGLKFAEKGHPPYSFLDGSRESTCDRPCLTTKVSLLSSRTNLHICLTLSHVHVRLRGQL